MPFAKVPRSARPGAAVLAAIPCVLQANEHLRDDHPLAVGHSTSSIDGQDIGFFASLNVVGGPWAGEPLTKAL